MILQNNVVTIAPPSQIKINRQLFMYYFYFGFTLRLLFTAFFNYLNFLNFSTFIFFLILCKISISRVSMNTVDFCLRLLFPLVFRFGLPNKSCATFDDKKVFCGLEQLGAG